MNTNKKSLDLAHKKKKLIPKITTSLILHYTKGTFLALMNNHHPQKKEKEILFCNAFMKERLFCTVDGKCFLCFFFFHIRKVRYLKLTFMRYASMFSLLVSEMLLGGFDMVHSERLKEEFNKNLKEFGRKKIIWKEFDTQQPRVVNRPTSPGPNPKI